MSSPLVSTKMHIIQQYLQQNCGLKQAADLAFVVELVSFKI